MHMHTCACVCCSLWEFVACAMVLSLVVPFCGIPALIFAVQSRLHYRRGDVARSRAANLVALRLITAGGVCLCALAVAASVLIAVFSHDTGPPTKSSTPMAAAGTSLSAGTAARQRPRVMSLSNNAFEKALQRHTQKTLLDSSRARTGNGPTRKSGGGLAGLIRKSGQSWFARRRRPAGNTTAAASELTQQRHT